MSSFFSSLLSLPAGGGPVHGTPSSYARAPVHLHAALHERPFSMDIQRIHGWQAAAMMEAREYHRYTEERPAHDCTEAAALRDMLDQHDIGMLGEGPQNTRQPSSPNPPQPPPHVAASITLSLTTTTKTTTYISDDIHSGMAKQAYEGRAHSGKHDVGAAACVTEQVAGRMGHMEAVAGAALAGGNRDGGAHPAMGLARGAGSGTGRWSKRVREAAWATCESTGRRKRKERKRESM
ncbi:hypothetical protein HU200_054142 [Digitaria exilis]|uniref:GTD-binding domain-containing protein n=1 Tax=Digitaria exilis TaxID=1010633 RepID=A0A835ALT9_9POAL|nr:hypothetical protein HU200_054142 [Digitaria exilis]